MVREIWDNPEATYPTFWSWIVLRDGVRPDDIRSTFDSILERTLATRSWNGRQMQDGVHPRPDIAKQSVLDLQPISRIHLYTRADYGIENAGGWSERYGDIDVLILFASGAGLLLLITAANFVNLTTAQGSGRSLEVGVRKTMGASQGQLSTQFLTESLLTTSCAAVVAHGLFSVTPSILLSLLDVSLPAGEPWSTVRDLLCLTLVLSLLCCGYPATHLASLTTSSVLVSHTQGRKSMGRQSMVVLQFVVSAVLIMVAGGISRQMDYVRGKDLGFDKEFLVTLPLFSADPTLRNRASDVRAAFYRHPDVLGVSVSSHPIGSHNRVDASIVSRMDRRDEKVRMDLLNVDEHFVQVYGLELIDGGNFGPTLDGGRCILNLKAARLLGYYTGGDDAESIVGRSIWRWGRELEVVGVVPDFHHGSLHRSVDPVILVNLIGNYHALNIRISPNRIPETIAFLESTWNQFAPDIPFRYGFLSEAFARFYAAEQLVDRALSLTAGLTIFTACLGILGLAAFLVRQRVKEVGVRRVLGASESSVFALLSSDFLRPVILANLIAVPIAWYGLDQWLNSFAYRISLGPTIFLFGALTGLLFAFASVAWQARSAARMSPADALRVQ